MGRAEWPAGRRRERAAGVSGAIDPAEVIRRPSGAALSRHPAPDGRLTHFRRRPAPLPPRRPATVTDRSTAGGRRPRLRCLLPDHVRQQRSCPDAPSPRDPDRGGTRHPTHPLAYLRTAVPSVISTGVFAPPPAAGLSGPRAVSGLH